MFDSCLRLSLNRRRRLPRLAALCADAYLRTEISGALYLAFSRFVCEILPPASRPFGERCIEKRQRRVFTSLRSHNSSSRQTDKSFFLSLPPLLLRFLWILPSSTFLAISMKYFKDRLPIVQSPRVSSAFRLGRNSFVRDIVATWLRYINCCTFNLRIHQSLFCSFKSDYYIE